MRSMCSLICITSFIVVTSFSSSTMMFFTIVSVFLLISITGAVEGRISKDQVKALCEQNGYHLYTTGCYKLHDVAVTWDTAHTKCVEEGAHLVIINDKAEAEVVNIVTKEYASDSYSFVGLQDQNGNGNWKSINGDRIEDLYNEWDETHTGMYRCGALKYTAKLDDLPCNGERSFICEK